MSTTARHLVIFAPFASTIDANRATPLAMLIVVEISINQRVLQHIWTKSGGTSLALPKRGHLNYLFFWFKVVIP